MKSDEIKYKFYIHKDTNEPFTDEEKLHVNFLENLEY